MKIDRALLSARLGRTDLDPVVADETRLAAIALVFRQQAEELFLCFGRRAINPLDPWSGDVAFPGGKIEPGDTTLHDVAARETLEEIGLQLSAESLVGRLDPLEASGGGTRPLTPVHPLVYLVEGDAAPFRLSDEMSDAFWVPVPQLWCRRNWVAFSFPPTRAQRAGISIGNHNLWGFSLAVLIELADLLGHSMQEIRALEEHVHVDRIASNAQS
ncbi:MAG: CoA pyrophosphatase [Pseudomonadota bacterium]